MHSPILGPAPAPPPADDQRVLGTVAVVGTGLIGTSIALALTGQGVTVHLDDHDPAHARTAASLGAGVTETADGPVDLAVIAVPPAHVGRTLRALQRRGVARAYTDVASVKVQPWRDVVALGCDAGTYVGGHPMAGRERSGPLAAQAGLFDGRAWVLSPSRRTGPYALRAATELVHRCGAVPVMMTPGLHDSAVALVSHAPHVVSALMAARLQYATDGELRLAGQGLRDVTRIAGGDPDLWVEILTANSAAVADVLEDLAQDLEGVANALRRSSQAGQDVRREGAELVRHTLRRGQTGHGRLPGKHGGARIPCEAVLVRIGDEPGELARLLDDTRTLGVNIEDVTIQHDAGRSGTVELLVAAGAAEKLACELGRQGWPCEVGEGA
ncbi:prephenate dehydrogenase [Streptomyces griseochromogenes]|uniref:Prephenate dehydrogenase n=1 Tax=Streptomyces griseochromogenes TaxID=68214 RepID=A0ABS4M2C6_9ACTN|nr:prephenate dehydrogenase [Streptomyces griseochromogenes]MBP2053834.1 prephenate dehydrogenase [Streptomyces griseochromogenes]